MVPASPREPALDWLEQLEEIPSPQGLFDGLCTRLVEAGRPICRAAVFVRTLHPNVYGRRFLWRRGMGVTVSQAGFTLPGTEEFLDNPTPDIVRDRRPIRRRLIDPGCPNDYRIVDELRAEGMTDYLAQPLPFTNGEVHMASWSTDAADGFSPSDLAALEVVRMPFTRLVEIYALRRTALTLLNTYVGRGAGARILEGHIQRGDLETIHAAIWFSDLRGFTPLADTLPSTDLVAMLNAFFDAQVPPLLAAGGEVLKFMGDGLLGIVPIVPGRTTEAEACAAACEAAAAAREAIAAHNAAADGAPALRFGLALHVGEVLYGNVGSAHRLDFTTIGPAVNLASRLESFAAAAGRDIVMSAAFAAASGAPAEPLGVQTLRGFRTPVEVFALPAPSTAVLG